MHTSRTRLAAAMRLERPDRVPVMCQPSLGFVLRQMPELDPIDVWHNHGGALARTWARVFTPAGSLLAGRGALSGVCTASPDARATELLASLAKTGPRARPPAEVVRATYRPTPHAGEALDLDVARQLVNDAALRTALRLPESGQLATSP